MPEYLFELTASGDFTTYRVKCANKAAILQYEVQIPPLRVQAESAAMIRRLRAKERGLIRYRLEESEFVERKIAGYQKDLTTFPPAEN